MNYEYEESQCKVDLSDMILEHLVDELVHLLNNKMDCTQDQLDILLLDT